MRLCDFPGCDRKHMGNGLCSGHATQLKRKGKLTALRQVSPRTRRKIATTLRVCVLDGCERSHYANGLCNRHWQKNRKYGNPLAGRWNAKHIHGTIEEKFWPKVDVQGPDECWLWTASTSYGYGQMVLAGLQTKAHEVSLYITTGEWSEPGEEVLHSCDVRACVNPAHLSRGTPKRNYLDAIERSRLLRDPTTGQFKTP